MKYLLLLTLILPILASGQVKMNDLITKRGLAYEMAGRVPFSGQAYTPFANGDTQTIITYKDGIPDGEVVSWYSKDHKQVEGVLEKGQKAGNAIAVPIVDSFESHINKEKPLVAF